MTDESPATETEPETASAAAAAAAPANPHTGRRIATWVAVVLSVVLFLTATAGVWAKTTVLSTDRVVKAVDAAASNPQVVDALSARLSDEILSLVDITALVQEVLPSQLDSVAPLIENFARTQVETQVHKLVDSPTGREILDRAVRAAHKEAIRVLEGKGLSDDSAVSVKDNQVVLDTVPLLVSALESLQQKGVLPGKFDIGQIVDNATSSGRVEAIAKVFGVTVPDNFGQIVLIDSDRVDEISSTLATARRALVVFQRAVFILVVLAFASIAAALFLSLDRRRTLAQIAIGIGVGAILMRLSIDQVVAAVGRAIEKAGAKAAALSITESLTESLARTLGVLAIVGIGLGIITYLLKPDDDGSPSWLTGQVRLHPGISVGVVLALCLALLAVVTLTWISFIIIAALGIGGLLYVNRQRSAVAAVE